MGKTFVKIHCPVCGERIYVEPDGDRLDFVNVNGELCWCVYSPEEYEEARRRAQQAWEEAQP